MQPLPASLQVERRIKRLGISIKDVAQEAGVSISTVSRVLSGGAPVSEEMREKVLQAVNKLNYKPNLVARALKRRQTRTLGLVVPELINPVFAVIADATEKAAREVGYNLILCNTRENEEWEAIYVDSMLQRWIAGLIFLQVINESVALEPFFKYDLPIVVIDRCTQFKQVPFVGVDNLGAGYDATRHLIELGHTRIAHIGGPMGLQLSQERLAGYRQALAEAGLPFDPHLVVEGDFYLKGGAKCTYELLSTAPDLTAIFSSNDLMALGVMQALRESGRQVPGDMSIVGMDNIFVTTVVDPPLTTVAQPLARMAEEAVRLVLKKIRGEPLESKEVILPCTLIVRGTTAPPRNNLDSGG